MVTLHLTNTSYDSHIILSRFDKTLSEIIS